MYVLEEAGGEPSQRERTKSVRRIFEIVRGPLPVIYIRLIDAHTRSLLSPKLSPSVYPRLYSHTTTMAPATYQLSMSPTFRHVARMLDT